MRAFLPRRSADVIRGRKFDFSKKFLPDGLSLAAGLDFLDGGERRLLSQVQGRTYANMFGLAERFIGAKVLEISSAHWLGDQTALEALVRFTEEELKHQELFRRLERLTAEQMAPGYKFLAQPNEVASIVLGKSTWAVLALTCNIEIFTQAHYRQSVEPDTGCPTCSRTAGLDDHAGAIPAHLRCARPDPQRLSRDSARRGKPAGRAPGWLHLHVARVAQRRHSCRLSAAVSG